MDLKKDHLNKIKEHFQLNIYELKIWTSLLSRGISSASELADISGVPRSRCYDVLETLEKKGFILMKIGKPIKYIAVSPVEVIFRLQKHIKEETQNQTKGIDDLGGSETFKELELLYKTGVTHIDPLEIAATVTGRINIAHITKGMFERCASKLIVGLPSDIARKKLVSMKNALKRLHKRRVKIVLHASDKKILEQFKEYSGFLSPSPLQFATIDGKEILFYTTDPLMNAQYESALWMDSPFLVKAMETMIERNLKP